MNKIKKIFLVIICFCVIFSIFNVHTSAFAVTVASGTYVAYSILVAALAACGVAVAASNVSPSTYQSILDSPGAEDVKALIGATAVLANSGSTYFHWTASEWATFTSWVNGNGMLNGSYVVPGSGGGGSVISNNFNVNNLGTYWTSPTPTSNGIIGASYFGATLLTIQGNGTYRNVQLNLSNGHFYFQNQFNFYNDYAPCYLVCSPFYLNSGNPIPRLVISVCVDSTGRIAHTASDIVKPNYIFADGVQYVSINGRNYTMIYSNGSIIAHAPPSAAYGDLTIAPTVNFETQYSSYVEWFTDVINSGSLVGDWTGIGDDVINPSDNEDDVGIDVYPPIAIPYGRNALPLDLGQGESIDIPLDPYLDRQTVSPGQDVIISNPPDWNDTVIDNTPEDIQPRVKVNPTTEVPPGSVDVPWADEQTWPVAYPQTQTGELEEAPPWEEAPTDTQNKPRENTNRMKLSALWLSKFPFSIPWDLKQGINQLLQSPEAPVFDIPFQNERLGIDESVRIDLSNFQPVANVSKWFLSALWVVILIILTKKMIWK